MGGAKNHGEPAPGKAHGKIFYAHAVCKKLRLPGVAETDAVQGLFADGGGNNGVYFATFQGGGGLLQMLQCGFCRVLGGVAGGAGDMLADELVLCALRYLFKSCGDDLGADACLVSQCIADDG